MRVLRESTFFSPAVSQRLGEDSNWNIENFPNVRKRKTKIVSKESREEVKEAMHEMKEGKLKSGSGKKVTNPKQAVAIGLSEAREKGEKVPKKKR